MGDNCLDVYVNSDRTFVGGNALNVAVNWRRSGFDAHYYGAVGDDPAGDLVLDELERQGLDPSDVVRLPGLTGVTLIEMRDGDRLFAFEEFGVGAAWQPGDAVLSDASGAEWVHVQAPGLSHGVMGDLMAKGCPVSVDLSTFGTVEGFGGCAVAFASVPAGRHEARERALELLDHGARRAVVTSGAQGAIGIGPEGEFRVPAVPTEVVDTCGAGDSFIAATIVELAAGAGLEAALREGAASAARTCGFVGGFPQEPRVTLPWIHEHYLRPRGYPAAGIAAGRENGA